MGQGAYILGCEGPRLNAAEAAFFRQAQPWGFILFARNVETPDQLRALTSDLRAAVGRQAPVLIDQEGGRVQRMTPPHWRQWLPPIDQVSRAGPNAARSMWLRYRIIAHELAEVGIDANCAPSGDIANPDTHPFLMNRCYGQSREVVEPVALAVADALQAGGCYAIAKHMPGHGRAVMDSHLTVPRVSAPRSELIETDFAPFRALNSLPLGMTAHIIFSQIDDQPATVSEVMNAVIRTEIGFKGMLMTDDISMEALDGTVAERSVAAIGAGCDAVLHCNGKLDEMEQVAAAVGAMNPQSQDRADRAIARHPQAMEFDIKAAEQELRDLVGEDAIG